MAEYTTKLQQYKVDAIKDLKENFAATKDFIFADYRGLNVEQITELRRQLREKGTMFRVIKNRYAKIAMEELDFPDVSDYLVGPTAVALVNEEASPAAKVIFDYARAASVTVKGGIIGGNVFGGKEVEELSKLPGRNELIARLMSAMNGPLTNLVRVIQAVPQKLVRTLQAVADQKGSE